MRGLVDYQSVGAKGNFPNSGISPDDEYDCASGGDVNWDQKAMDQNI